ncbi:MAG: formylmethanofuran dehydrogenase subunit B [Methanobacteriota archaeon]
MQVKNVVCPFCGCLCDDITVDIENNIITGVENACTLGAHKFLEDQNLRLKGPIMRDGAGWKDISYEEALEYTIGILKDADRPLLYGWSSSPTETQALGAHLAELISGVVDSTSTVCHGPSILAIQEVGHPGCTLGQVKNRADTIIYWGANPIEAHPRHMSRYTTQADAFFIENSFRGRRVIVVDVRKTATAEVAEEFVKIEQGGDYAVLSALRAIVRGRSDVIPDYVAGVSKTQLIRITDICKEAKFGAVFFGLGVTMTGGKYKNIRNAIELVAELNRHTKWTITPMRGHWNVYGSNEVFTWITGYPFGVDYSRGIAFYNPGETTAVDILARGEADAAVIVGSDPGAHFPRVCNEHLAKIPTILFDPYPSTTTHVSTVQIPSAVNGIDAEGTAYRMDGIPIKTRKVLDLGYPTDTSLFETIYQKIKDIKGGEDPCMNS